MAQKIDLTTADLGRHIKNGAIILEERKYQVLFKNFYSYTWPDFPFLNHHWGSGVVFYLIWKYFGFFGLQLCFICLFLIAFLLFFLTAVERSNFKVSYWSGIALLPLLTFRKEVRPEVFTYVFSGIFVYFLYQRNEKRRKLIYILPFIEVLWVNLHVYFWLGILLIGTFFLFSFLEKKWLDARRFGLIGLGCCLGCLINPFGLQGAIYPLRIFSNYGYRVLENQPIWYLDKLIKYPPGFYFKFFFLIVSLSFILRLLRKEKILIIDFFLYIIISFLGWIAVRNFTLFALFSLLFLSKNLSGLIRLEHGDWLKELLGIFYISLVILLIVAGINMPFFKMKGEWGIGLKKGTQDSVNFFRENQIHGPIFNNYDIGGYLIFYFFPEERVFVDNRPEAYPREFFENTYLPAQLKNEEWEKLLAEYNFNVIYFYKNDLTDWGRSFLQKRIVDKNWALVWKDDNILIFLRQNEENRKVIEKHLVGL